MSTHTNTPGGIFGAIAKAVIASGDATPEMTEWYEVRKKAWKDAGLEEGEMAVVVGNGYVKEGSPEHIELEKQHLRRFKTPDGKPII